MTDDARERIAAVLVAELAGPADGADVANGFGAWQNVRDTVLDQIVAAHMGHVAQSGGSGVVAEFPDADSALSCALALRREVDERTPLDLRTGVHYGDVTGEGETLGGEAVDVATRLGAMATPGSICVSAVVRDHATAKVASSLVESRVERLPGIAVPVTVWRTRAPGEAPAPAAAPDVAKRRRSPVGLIAAAAVVIALGGALAWWQPWSEPAPEATPIAAATAPPPAEPAKPEAAKPEPAQAQAEPAPAPEPAQPEPAQAQAEPAPAPVAAVAPPASELPKIEPAAEPAPAPAAAVAPPTPDLPKTEAEAAPTAITATASAPAVSEPPKPEPPRSAPEPPKAEAAPAAPAAVASLAPDNDAMAEQRKALAAKLADYDCAHLSVAGTSDGTRVSGFVSSPGDLQRVRDLAGGAYASLDAKLDVTVQPRPYCEAIVHLDAHAPRKAGVAPDSGIETNHPDRHYRNGDSFVATITAPGEGTRYLWIAYMSGKGDVTRIYPASGVDGRVSAGEKVILGKDGRFHISAPFGRDMLIEIASDAPLAGQLAGPWATPRDFLDALSIAFYEMPDKERLESRYVFIDTQP